MSKMLVLRAFDLYQPGQEMRAADVADQERRGNLPDLLRKGFIVEETVEAAEQALDELREQAQALGIRGWHNMGREKLEERVADALRDA